MATRFNIDRFCAPAMRGSGTTPGPRWPTAARNMPTTRTVAGPQTQSRYGIDVNAAMAGKGPR